MKKRLFYALTIALCGAVSFSSCTKDYDDDLRIQRELIENNDKELRALIDAYQVLVENTIEQIDIAYKNADDLIRQQMKAEFDAAKLRLTDLETALSAAEDNIDALQSDLTTFKAAVNVDFQRVNAHIEAINARIDNVELRIAALNTRLTTVETAIVDMKAWKTLAEAKLAELEAAQNADKAEIEALKNRIAAVEARITALEGQLAALTEAMNAADAALGARIDDLTAQLGVQETSLTALITSVQTSLTDKINDFKAQITQAFAEYKDSVDAGLGEMAADVAEAVGEINDLTASLTQLSGRVDTLEAKAAELTAQIAGLASAEELKALTARVDAIYLELRARDKELELMIANNTADLEAEIEARKADIAALKQQLADMQADLEQKIADAIADKVTKTEMDEAIEAAVAQLTADYQAADDALQALIDQINDTTIPALETRIDSIETFIENYKNRIQVLKWIPSDSKGNIELWYHTDMASEYIDITAEIYIVSNAADIIDRIIAAGSVYKVEVVVNRAATRAIIANPFGNMVLRAGSAANTLSIKLNYLDQEAFKATYTGITSGTAMDLQLAVKITDDKGNTSMTDFTGVTFRTDVLP